MANEKILVVDDDTNICELLRLYLTKEGYQVTTANDGEEGLEKFNQLKPDMVLLDVMMPKMDGLEVCRRIRKLGNTPVMMLTAKGETFDKVLGLERRAVGSAGDQDRTVGGGAGTHHNGGAGERGTAGKRGSGSKGGELEMTHEYSPHKWLERLFFSSSRRKYFGNLWSGVPKGRRESERSL